MFCVSYKREVNGKIQEDGYENFLTDLFIPDVVRRLIKDGYTDIRIEKH